MSTGLLKIQSLKDVIKKVHKFPDLRFVMVNRSLLLLKFRECNLQKRVVNFQKSLCQHSENRLTKIFLQINLCFIMRDAFKSLR